MFQARLLIYLPIAAQMNTLPAIWTLFDCHKWLGTYELRRDGRHLRTPRLRRIYAPPFYRKIWINQNLDCTIITSSIWTLKTVVKVCFYSTWKSRYLSEQVPITSVWLEYCWRQIRKSRPIWPRGKSYGSNYFIFGSNIEK